MYSGCPKTPDPLADLLVQKSSCAVVFKICILWLRKYIVKDQIGLINLLKPLSLMMQLGSHIQIHFTAHRLKVKIV